MARALAAVALLTFALPAPAAGPWRADAEAAMAEATQSGKPVLLVFSARWCGPCQRMAASVFPDPAVARLLRDDYVPVKVNCDEGSALADKLRVTGLPTMVVLSPEGKELGRRSGSAEAGDVAQWLGQFRGRAAVAPAPRQPPADPWAAGHRELARALARTSTPASAPR